MNSKQLTSTSEEPLQKRVCLTLDLKNDPLLIEKYKYYHSKENHWKVISDGIKQAGIKLMDIYCFENRMFMICELAIEDDFDACWKKIGNYPQQEKWAELMAQYVKPLRGDKVEWMKMEKIFEL